MCQSSILEITRWHYSWEFCLSQFVILILAENRTESRLNLAHDIVDHIHRIIIIKLIYFLYYSIKNKWNVNAVIASTWNQDIFLSLEGRRFKLKKSQEYYKDNIILHENKTGYPKNHYKVTVLLLLKNFVFF